jgi:hypothetical protein
VHIEKKPRKNLMELKKYVYQRVNPRSFSVQRHPIIKQALAKDLPSVDSQGGDLYRQNLMRAPVPHPDNRETFLRIKNPNA